jgi:hypothetical protein
MAVTLDLNAAADSTANGVTTINHTMGGAGVGSGSNRALVVQLVLSRTVTNLGMRWDEAGTPQAMTAITGASATNTAFVQLWGLIAPTSGNKTLKVGNGSGGSWTTACDVYVNAVSWTGVDQTGGATSFPHGTGGTGTGDPATVTVTSAVGNATMAVHETTNQSWASVNNTQSFIDNIAANVSGCGNRAAGAATVTLTGTSGGGTAPVWASAGTDIVASGGGAAATVKQLAALGVG